VFGDELIMGSIRAQSIRLKSILAQMEEDEKWKHHSSYYAGQLQEVERLLRKIRKTDIEPINSNPA